MDELARLIRAHRAAEPDNFDGREHLYMERENLRATLLR